MESETRVLEKENLTSFLKPKPLRLRKKAPRPLPPPLHEVDTNSRGTKPLLKSPKVPRNPFRRNEAKRKLDPEDEDDHSLLWRHSHRSLDSEPKHPCIVSPVVPSMLDECALSPFSLQPETKDQKPSPSPSLPVDWSLKTKIRFTSSTPFPSRGNFRTFEEVNGTIGFVRCLHPGETDKPDVHSSHGAKLFQQSLVWMHPSLPWLNLFPRTHRSSGSPTLSASAQEILHSKWCDSFRSLYQLVRLYQCPFFYLCAPAFTVLFRCAGAASIPELNAMISPTTQGLRKALEEEGISFEMPLRRDTDSPSCDTADEILDENTEEMAGGLEEDDESWLESLGLSQEAYPSLRKKRRRGDLSHRVDHRPQSLVLVKDAETQALVNFLLCSSFCSDKIGPMSGIPPTLLAPVAFLGGTLQSLQMRHGKVKQGDSELESVELSGPLLPNAVHSLCSLLASTQPSFNATITSHAPTEAFTQVEAQSPSVTIFAQNNLADCGLPAPFVHQMCCTPTPTHSLRAENGLFTLLQ